jgi:triacylglycerol esterase/lipase EstA (alpha/beta hydrolase family)
MRNQTFIKNLLKKITPLVLTAAIFGGAFSAAGQTRRTPTRPAKTSTAPVGKSACNGGWSGIVTFTKTRNYQYDSGKQKQIPQGTAQTKSTEDYQYTGRIVVDGSQGARLLQTRAQVSASDTRKTWKRQEQYDTCFYDGKDGSVLQWTEKNESDITNAFGEGEAQFRLNVNELGGNYTFNFRLPDAPGVNDRAYSQTSGGWCSPDFNKPSSRTDKYPIKVDGLGTEIADGKIDPARPDVLSGSKNWEETVGYNSSKWVYAVTWSFKRCPAPIEVTDIRFDEHFYPDYQTWKEIETARGTVDGNRVRIRATVTNFSGETKFPQIKFNETVENWVLPDGETSIRLEPGEAREIELEWDTSGYAWRGKGYDAESYRKIKVEAIDGSRTSELTKLIVVKPRPVILVHGLWSNAAAWTGYDKYFEEGHSRAWKTFAVGANPSVAKMNTGETFGNTAQTKTIAQNAAELRKQIEFTRKDLNSWHVDLVAHSMGGLISRYYINEDMPLNPLSRKPVVTRLIMLGTPNQGSPCADLMYRALAATGNKVWALYELMPSVVLKFNETVKNRNGVRFSALAGWRIPNTCQSPASGDGVVSIGSARWFVMDWKYSNSLAHTDLTSRADFGSFVFPRLSIGPRGNHDPELVADNDSVETPAERRGFNSVFQNASYQKSSNAKRADDPADAATLEGLTLAKEIELSANQTTDLEIPMQNGSRGSIIFVAAPGVSATLFDPKGAIIGANLTGTPESKQMFRAITIEKSIAAGTWKLKLENKSATEANLILAAFADPNPLALELAVGKPNAAGQIAVRAKLIDTGASVSGGSVKARIESAAGKTLELILLDDGAHGDGAANDGIYAASTKEKLADGDYLIEAVAETAGQTRRAVANLTVGAPAKKELSPRSKK